MLCLSPSSNSTLFSSSAAVNRSCGQCFFCTSNICCHNAPLCQRERGLLVWVVAVRGGGESSAWGVQKMREFFRRKKMPEQYVLHTYVVSSDSTVHRAVPYVRSTLNTSSIVQYPVVDMPHDERPVLPVL